LAEGEKCARRKENFAKRSENSGGKAVNASVSWARKLRGGGSKFTGAESRKCTRNDDFASLANAGEKRREKPAEGGKWERGGGRSSVAAKHGRKADVGNCRRRIADDCGCGRNWESGAGEAGGRNFEGADDVGGGNEGKGRSPDGEEALCAVRIRATTRDAASRGDAARDIASSADVVVSLQVKRTTGPWFTGSGVLLKMEVGIRKRAWQRV